MYNKKACDLGYLKSCSEVESLVANHRSNYKKSCDGGDAAACFQLGVILGNIQNAKVSFKKSCDGEIWVAVSISGF